MFCSQEGGQMHQSPVGLQPKNKINTKISYIRKLIDWQFKNSDNFRSLKQHFYLHSRIELQLKLRAKSTNIRLKCNGYVLSFKAKYLQIIYEIINVYLFI